MATKRDRTPNLAEGKNPNTGKEFFLLTKTGNILRKRASYQTRTGAERNRKDGEWLLSGANIRRRMQETKDAKQHNAFRLERLRASIAELERKRLEKGPGVIDEMLDNRIKSLEGQLPALTRSNFLNFEEIAPHV